MNDPNVQLAAATVFAGCFAYSTYLTVIFIQEKMYARAAAAATAVAVVVATFIGVAF